MSANRLTLGCLGSGEGIAYEVNADSRYVALCVCVVCKSEEQTGLSDSGITDEEQLEEVVVSVLLAGQRVAWEGILPQGAMLCYLSIRSQKRVVEL